MLVGEPGIGKTRTALGARDLRRAARRAGAWGRCYESEGAPPYWPWVQAIRAYVREREPEQLRAEMGAGAAEIAEIVSDVRERLPDLPEPPSVRGPGAGALPPLRLAHRVPEERGAHAAARARARRPALGGRAVAAPAPVPRARAGRRAPADPRHLPRRRAPRQHPLVADAGRAAPASALFERILLRGLSEEDVGRFVEADRGLAPPAELVEAVYTQTEGNPFFVNEVVRLLVQEGELTPGTARRSARAGACASPRACAR